MKVLKVCASEWKNASRDKRELSVCRELGMEVFVLAKGEGGDNIVDGFKVYRATSRPLGKLVMTPINRVVALFTWAYKARKIRPDIISGHDLSGLTIGYLSTLFIKKKNKAKLVYDSHEFELGRNVQRSKVTTVLIKKLEGFLIRRCAFSIMVNDEIADRVQSIYNLQQRSIVVRNIPSTWLIEKDVIDSTREELCKALKAPSDSFIVMYHGALVNGRGIETLIEIVGVNPNIYGFVLGNGDERYLQKLHTMAKEKGSFDRILFKQAVPITELWRYVGAASVGLIIIPAICESYYLCLPNKFFENIQSETPVVCSDYPAMRNLIDKYNNGVVCDATNVDIVNRAIEELRQNPRLYSEKKKGAIRAKIDLCWEKEKIVLRDAYNALMK